MSDHNHAHFTGRIDQDVEVRYGQSGNAFASLRVWIGGEKGKEGKTEKSAWVDVKVFGALAERFNGAEKGDKVEVLGKLCTDSWEGKDGKKQYRLVIYADAARFVEKDEGAEPKAKPARAQKSPRNTPAAAEDDATDYGDIPF